MTPDPELDEIFTNTMDSFERAIGVLREEYRRGMYLQAAKSATVLSMSLGNMAQGLAAVAKRKGTDNGGPNPN